MGREALAEETVVLLVPSAGPAPPEEVAPPRASHSFVAPADLIGVPVACPEVQPPMLGARALRRRRGLGRDSRHSPAHKDRRKQDGNAAGTPRTQRERVKQT